MSDVQPQRISTMPTASQVARQRALDKIGKDLAWFDEQVEASLNEHGEPTCAECKQPEKKKLPGGQIKMLTIDTKIVRLVCDSCANKAYKAQMRENVSKRHDRDSVAIGDEFWNRNRKKLTEAEKAQFEARDEEINLLADEMKNVLVASAEGRDFDEPALRDFIREVCREVMDNGTVFVDVTLTDFFRPERKALYDDIVAKGGANARFLQYGYFDAIPVIAPNSIVSQFFQFAERHFGLPIAIYETHATRIERILDVLDFGKVYQQPGYTVKCATPSCAAIRSFQPFEVAPSQWWCSACQAERDKAARLAYAKIADRKIQEQITRDATKDSCGREKLYGEGGPYG